MTRRTQACRNGGVPHQEAVSSWHAGVIVIGDELSAEERTALHASLDRALDDSESGRSTDAAEYLKQYRARRHDRERGLIEVHSIWGARRERGPGL